MSARTYHLHLAVSVDVDRHDNMTLQREILPFLRIDGRPVTAYELRRLCDEERAKGHVVFPPCDNTKPDGTCAGHPEGEP